MSNIEYNGDRVFRQAQRVVIERLDASGRLVRNQARTLLSREGRFVPGGVLTKSGKRVQQRLAVPLRSKPGEPPRKQTGDLRKSVQAVLSSSELKMRVGTGKLYGAYLERGAPKINLAPRPWLIRAIREKSAQIARLFARWSTR
jgi:hypothetical protein